MCTAKREKRLASPLAHEAVVGAWSLATKWLVGRYVILPDHFHFFCAPSERDAPSLETWMRYWKSIVSRNLHDTGGTPLWQRDHWDRQLRRGESYDEKWDYVRNNPVRHGLVSDADAWPYQGELNELRWGAKTLDAQKRVPPEGPASAGPRPGSPNANEDLLRRG